MQALGLRFTALAGRIRLVSVRQHHSFKIPQPLRQTVRQQRNNSTVAPDSPHNKSTTTGPKIPTAAVIPPLPLWQRLGPLTWAIQGFGRAQRKRPYTTQFISTLVIYFLGDLGAQSLRDGDYEPERTAKSLAIGAGSSIPTYLWFIYLGNSFNYASLPLSINILIKVLINQILYTPIFNTYFFGMQSLLSFHHSVFSLEAYYAAWEHVKRTVPTSFVNSCKLWPGVTAFNFWVVPQDFRSIFAGVIAIGWQTYLSFLNRKAEKEEAVEQARLALLEGAAKSEVLKATAPVEAVPAKAQMNARLATDASNSDRNRKA